jgi:hypothetical protein
LWGRLGVGAPPPVAAAALVLVSVVAIGER